MPARVEIRGTGEFRRVAAQLRQAGDGRLTREMSKKMRTAATPMVAEAQRGVRAIASTGTARGGGGQARRAHTVGRARRRSDRVHQRAFAGRGLRASIARAVGTQVRSTGRSASVRIRVNSSKLPPDQRTLPAALNRGHWRHPVFGNKNAWITQTARPPGWWDRPVRRHGAQIRDQAVSVVADIQRQIMR